MSDTGGFLVFSRKKFKRERERFPLILLCYNKNVLNIFSNQFWEELNLYLFLNDIIFLLFLNLGFKIFKILY